MGVIKDAMKLIPGMAYLRKKRYKTYFSEASNLNLFYGVFKDFHSAESEIPKTKAVGYNHDEPAQMYDNLFKDTSPSDFPALFWLERLKSEVQNIYDFGGHVGIKYYSYSQYLSEREGRGWTTYDLPTVVNRGRQIALDRNAISLKFSGDVKDLEGQDLLLASGSLQYLEDPFTLLFSGLNNKPRYVLFNMIPVTEKKSYVTIQNIGTAFCPYKIFERTYILEQLTSYGYTLVQSWENPEKVCIIPFNEEFNVIGYSGFLFKC